MQAAVEELRPLGRQQDGSTRGGAVHGMGCNVARPAEVAAFADFAKEQLGTVDMWIKWVLRKTWVLAMACWGSAQRRSFWAQWTCGPSGCLLTPGLWLSRLPRKQLGSRRYVRPVAAR